MEFNITVIRILLIDLSGIFPREKDLNRVVGTAQLKGNGRVSPFSLKNVERERELAVVPGF